MSTNTFNEYDHRLHQDECSVIARNLQDKSVLDYNTWNHVPTHKNECSSETTKINQFASDNYMTIKDGFGMTGGCTVDADSKLRNDAQWVSDRHKTQLHPRIFQSVPGLRRGGLISEVEGPLQQGIDTWADRPCNVLSEVSLLSYTQMPMISCLKENIQNPNHLVEPWTRGGEFTRDVGKHNCNVYDSKLTK
jgi:hypothetical protein